MEVLRQSMDGTMAYRTIFRPGLFAGQVTIVTGSALRVDGGRPQMRAGWPLGKDGSDAGNERATVKPFDGFPLAVVPKVLQGGQE